MRTMTRTTLAILAGLLATAGLVRAEDSGYHPDVGDYAAIVDGGEEKFPFNFGPTGTTGWFYGREFVINGLDAGSPADGVLKLGDRIRAVNGRRLPPESPTDDMKDPRRIMGMGITESETEAMGGKLTVTVWRDGREQDLTIKLPVMGSYSKTWPYECEKSAKILDNACKWLADRQKPEGAFVDDRADGFALGPALDGLLLLSSGDPRYLENARRLAYNFAEHPGPDPFKGEKTGTDLWGWSYQAIFVAEYYLRTGDTSVLPYLKWLERIIMAARGPRGGWSHGFVMANYAVGGYINPNGVSSLTALGLMDHAGLKIDQRLFDGSKLYFRRWSYGGRGIHYGDHKSELSTEPGHSFGAGKNAFAVVTFEVLGEKDASMRFANTLLDSYKKRDGCHAGPFFSLFWGPIGASRLSPAEFRMFMNYWTWFHDLSRRWDGSFLLPSRNGGGGYTARGPVFTMGGQALVYALPRKITRCCGATESPFGVKTMPAELQPVKDLVDARKYTAAAKLVQTMLDGHELSDAGRRRAALMRDSLATTLASIDYTLDQIAKDLDAGRAVLARTRIANLERLLGGGDEKLAALKRRASTPANDAIVKAWQTYQQTKLACYCDAGSYRTMQGLAGNSAAGFVQAKAAERLEAVRRWPSYVDSFCTESIYHEYNAGLEEDNKDPIALGVMRMLAFGNGVLWPTYVPRNKLTAQGRLGEFPFSTPLAATSDNGPARWKYLTSDEPTPPAGWQKPGFDDSAWPETNAPLVKPGRKPTPDQKWDKPYLLLRRSFDAASTDYDALRIKCKAYDPVDVYLNGRHVGRVLQSKRRNDGYIDFDITNAGLGVLKKGRNVLAVKSTRSGGFMDVGLLGVRKNLREQSSRKVQAASAR